MPRNRILIDYIYNDGARLKCFAYRYPTLFNKSIECATYSAYLIKVLISYHGTILHELQSSREYLADNTFTPTGSMLHEIIDLSEESANEEGLEEQSSLGRERNGNKNKLPLQYIQDPAKQKLYGGRSKDNLLKKSEELAILFGLSVTVGSESQSESQNSSQNLVEFSSSQYENQNTVDVTAGDVRAVETPDETKNTTNISTNTNNNSNFINGSGIVEVIDQDETPNTANDINDSIKQDAASPFLDLSNWFKGGSRGSNTDISEIDSNRDDQEEFDDNNNTLEQAAISNQYEEHNPHGNLDIRQEKSSDVLHEDPKGIIIYEESGSFFGEQLSPKIHFKYLTNDEREAFLENINAATFESNSSRNL
ncbi:hypothetical protein DFJ63DRAFT_315458 [Scheffersomyces coipomensis]|uniref:uncharacterized protein n=1 Tax=Scheffersomyces coipomensis TaxID=1788519 RepID=UPI00315DFD46